MLKSSINSFFHTSPTLILKIHTAMRFTDFSTKYTFVCKTKSWSISSKINTYKYLVSCLFTVGQLGWGCPRKLGESKLITYLYISTTCQLLLAQIATAYFLPLYCVAGLMGSLTKISCILLSGRLRCTRTQINSWQKHLNIVLVLTKWNKET